MRVKISRSIVQAMLHFLKRSRFNSFFAGFSLILVTLSLLYWFFIGVITPTFIRLAPASWFLQFYTVEVSDAQIGNVPDLKLCRTVHAGNVKIDAIRTFIMIDGKGDTREVKEYTFDANISDQNGEQPCNTVPLKQQPQEVGKYRTRTEFTFYVNGIEKKDSYVSNDYEMRDTIQSINDEIRRLQEIIRDLESRLVSLDAGSSGNSASQSTSRVQASPAPQASQPADEQVAASPSVRPADTLPPARPEGTVLQRAVGDTLNGVNNAVSGIVKGITER